MQLIFFLIRGMKNRDYKTDIRQDDVPSLANPSGTNVVYYEHQIQRVKR